MFAAFVAGFLYAMPLGPLGQMALLSASKGEIKKSITIVLAFSIVTMIISMLFLGGLGSVFMWSPALKFFVQLAGAVAVSIIFYRMMTRSQEKKDSDVSGDVEKSESFTSLFLLSAGATLANPMILVFWINFTPFMLSIVKVKTFTGLLSLSLVFSLGSFVSGTSFSLLALFVSGNVSFFKKIFKVALVVFMVLTAVAISYSLYISFGEAFLGKKDASSLSAPNSSKMIENILGNGTH